MINLPRIAMAFVFSMTTLVVPGAHAQTTTEETEAVKDLNYSDLQKANSNVSSIQNANTTGTANELAAEAIGTAPSANQSAKKSSNSGKIVALVAVGVGAALLIKGKALSSSIPTKPIGIALIVLGGLALMQGSKNADSSVQNNGVAGQVAASGSGGTSTSGTGTGTSTDGSLGVSGFTAAEIEKKLAANGVKFDTKSGVFTLPNGKKISATDVGNPQAMADAGIPMSDFNKALAIASEAEKKELAKYGEIGAATAENGFEGGGGSGGGSKVVEILEDGPGGYGAGAGGVGANGRNPAASNVAGMVRNYNGDNIGVAGDDIFEMMARRYREKSNNGTNFLPEGAAPAAAPAAKASP